MQILLHSESNLDSNDQMSEHLETVVSGSLGRFGERVTRVEARLSDKDGRARLGAGSIHCMLEARVTGLDAVVVSEQGTNVHQAIEGGVRKLKHAVGAAIGKHDPRRHRAIKEAGRATTTPPDHLGAGTEPA